MGQYPFELPFAPKPITCLLTWPDDSGAIVSPDDRPIPSLIFTHGAGGTLTSEAVANFSLGFAARLPILGFQGNMNLTSRVRMFNAVIEEQKSSICFGGRSMGARAAVMAARDSTTHLVLVSYPLHTKNEQRDQILLELEQKVKVIFVSGDRDSMCNLERLEEVRGKMKCLTWRIVVRDADHGMNIRPKAATTEVVEKSGDVVAAWINASDDGQREGMILWNSEGHAEWSGWSSESAFIDNNVNADGKLVTRPEKPVEKETSSKRTKDIDVAQSPDAVESVAKRTRKRRKA